MFPVPKQFQYFKIPIPLLIIPLINLISCILRFVCSIEDISYGINRFQLRKQTSLCELLQMHVRMHMRTAIYNR
jgi:hypothetical protein